MLELPEGIDNQYEPWPVYLFHMVIGHHGIFSLSPIFILTLLGLWRVMRNSRDSLYAFGLLAAGLTLILFCFYLFIAGYRNYGGICNGLRWFFWLIPLWLIFLPLGILEKANCRWFRAMALIFLVISVASTFYAVKNPWTRPWLHEWLYYYQWIRY